MVAFPVLNVPALHAVHVVASIWASLVENPAGQMSQRALLARPVAFDHVPLSQGCAAELPAAQPLPDGHSLSCTVAS